MEDYEGDEMAEPAPELELKDKSSLITPPREPSITSPERDRLGTATLRQQLGRALGRAFYEAIKHRSSIKLGVR